jgi:hypothetical protein
MNEQQMEMQQKKILKLAILELKIHRGYTINLHLPDYQPKPVLQVLDRHFDLADTTNWGALD